MRRFAFVLSLSLLTTPAAAQVLRGTVSDSSTRRPIPGAVLLLLDSSGTLLGRNITNERGEYSVALSAAMRRVRVQRIGFRPREARIPQTAVGENARLDIAMPALPTFLEPVHVTASACGRRSDQGSAMALLEQARAGLLTTVVGRATKPASIVLLTFNRWMAGTSDRIDSQTVRMDSGYSRAISFNAVRSAGDFVQRGFMEERDGEQIFFAPDADVLLDDRFSEGYCFRVMEPNRARPNQVGLGFSPANARRERVDINGALWIDTVARALRDIEFRYTGLDRRVMTFEPGGRLSFAEMSNGLVLVDRWSLRLVATRVDSFPGSRPTEREAAFSLHEAGGELAHASWRDGTVWHGNLGKLDVQALTRDGRQLARGLKLSLVGTPYRGTSDSTGRVLMSDLLPGPYSLIIEDSALATIDLTIPTELRFMSNRDSLAFAVRTRTPDEFVIDRCLAGQRYRYGGPDDTTRVIARIVDSGGKPQRDIRWRMMQNARIEDPTSPWTLLREGGSTGTDGIIVVCQPTLKRNATIELTLTYDGASRAIRHRLTDRVNVLRLTFDGK